MSGDGHRFSVRGSIPRVDGDPDRRRTENIALDVTAADVDGALVVAREAHPDITVFEVVHRGGKTIYLGRDPAGAFHIGIEGLAMNDDKREWTFCVEHEIVVGGGECHLCHGDRNLIQVVPASEHMALLADWNELRDIVDNRIVPHAQDLERALRRLAADPTDGSALLDARAVIAETDRWRTPRNAGERTEGT